MMTYISNWPSHQILENDFWSNICSDIQSSVLKMGREGTGKKTDIFAKIGKSERDDTRRDVCLVFGDIDIKTHLQSGYDILKDMDFPWPIARMILEHHERMNGSGYPSGLRGDQLLIESRILMVADVVEAMASHRPYRAGLGIEEALQEIVKHRGVLLR